MAAFQAVVPLLVVILTAVLSGYVVPRLTRNWQDHQREIDIKTSLIEEINAAVVEIILAIQLAERKALPQKDFDEAYRKWELQRALLAAKIRVYCAESELADSFDNYFEAVTNVYVLSGVTHPEYRAEHVRKLRQYFGERATNWVALEDQDFRRENFFDWFFSWWGLREAALSRKDDLVRRILTSRVRLTAKSA